MPANKNPLITSDLSSTIENLDDFLRFLCIASEDDDACHAGMAHSLRLAADAVSWMKAQTITKQQ